MKYFNLLTEGDLNNPSICLIKDAPIGMGIHDYRLALGNKAAEHYPSDAKIYLREEEPGIKLTDILGNTNGYFIASRRVLAIIQEMCKSNEIEYLGFTLYNQKRKIYSTDYFFINPVGGVSCLNNEASGTIYDTDGDILSIEQLVLDNKKLAGLPHLFRIDLDRGTYVISSELSDRLFDLGTSNLILEELPIVN